jgi:hypothetical protein
MLLIAAPAASAQQVPPPDAPPQTPPTQPPPPPPPPAPTPAEGKGSIAVTTGLSDRGHRYVAAGRQISLSGRAKPFVAGQTLIVELFRGRKRVGHRTVRIVDARDGAGSFKVSFRVRSAGVYTVKARHQATPEQARFTFARQRFEALAGNVGGGSPSKRVRVVQVALSRLAFVTPVNGHWDAATSRAVTAFRKVNRMPRTGGDISKRGLQMLLNGQGGFKLRYPKAGKHVEADLSRQVIVLARDGRPERIYTMSSGKASTPTVVGSFRFYRKSPGTNAKGMVHSSYFIRGYAIHGYKDVPNYNASHGCLRVPIPNARSIFDWVRLGDRIDVYR